MTRHRILCPNWPCLKHFSISDCHLEYSFLRIFLSNAPALQSLSICNVAISELEQMDLSTASVDRQTDTIPRHEKDVAQGGLENNSNIEASVITRMSFSAVVGLQLTDILLLASKLPHLSEFECGLKGNTIKIPVASLDQESRSVLDGFQSLVDLSLFYCSFQDTTDVLHYFTVYKMAFLLSH